MGKWEDLHSQVLAALSVGNFQRAIEVLVLGDQDRMVAYCAFMLGDATDGEEMAQEVFLAAFRALPHFRGEALVKTWLYTIARNQCLKYRSRRRRQRQIAADRRDEVGEAVHSYSPVSPEVSLLEAEKDAREEKQRELIPQNLQRLKRRDKDLLTMRYIEEISIADIARRIWMSEATARRRLRAAEQQLKQIYLRDIVDHDA